MPSSKQRIIKASDLTEDQLASAGDFLTRNNWTENEESRTVPRSEIAKLIAWYGALRFLAGADGVGTLEKPPRLLQSNGRPATDAKQANFGSDFEVIDLTDGSLNR